MPTIYEYLTDDGGTVRIETTASPAETGGEPLRGGYRSHEAETAAPKKLAVRFEEALGTVKAAADGLKKVIDQVNPDEVSVEFSLKAEGETGFFSICRAASSAEFKITLSWKNDKKT